MTRRRVEVATLLLLCGALAIAGFRLLSNPLRDFEQTAVLDVLGRPAQVSIVGSHSFQVLPGVYEPFRAALTPYCSSLITVLALAAITMFVLRAPLWRRLSALAIAAAVIVCCNVLRIAASLLIGLHYGSASLVLFHDWVGTAFAMLYTMGGFFLLVFFLLPDAKARIPRAARVSDVL
jgi:exosortase/archaeosortase family protein